MVRKVLFIFSLFLVGLLPTMALAQGSGLPGSGWFTGQQIQNVGTDSATISIMAYDANGASTYAGDDRTLAIGASTTYLPADFVSMPDGFIGSAVVASTQPARGIVNETNLVAAGQYQGVAGELTSTTVSFPLAKQAFNGKTTTFYIQNAGDDAATMTATFQSSNGVSAGAAPITSPSIDPSRTWVLILAGDIDDGALGSLTVTSDNALAGVVNEHPVSDTTVLQATRGFGSSDAGTTISAPIFKQKFNGRSTGMQVQNTSDGPVDITMTVNYSAGGTGTATATNVAAGASATFFNGLIIGGDGGSYTINDGLGAATFTADGSAELVGIVNETSDSGRLTQTTYSMSATSNATQTVNVPLYKETLSNKGSGIQVQNTTGTDATVQLELQLATSPTAAPTTYTLSGVTIAAGTSGTFFKLNSADCIGCSSNGSWAGGNRPALGTFGGVTVTANQNVSVIVQETDFGGEQDNKNYEGFNQ